MDTVLIINFVVINETKKFIRNIILQQNIIYYIVNQKKMLVDLKHPWYHLLYLLAEYHKKAQLYAKVK